MSKETESSLMCRACMKVDGVFLPMYGDYTITKKKNFPHKLADIASIQIDEYDGLPGVLCAKCAYRTDAFHEFKLQVQATEKKLRKMFQHSLKQVDSAKSDVVEEQSGVCENFAKDEASMGEEHSQDDALLAGESRIFEKPREIGESSIFESFHIVQDHEQQANDDLRSVEEALSAGTLEDRSESCQIESSIQKSELCNDIRENFGSDDMNYVFVCVPEEEEQVDLADMSRERLIIGAGEGSVEEEDEGILYNTIELSREASPLAINLKNEDTRIGESDSSVSGAMTRDERQEIETNFEEPESSLECDKRLVGSLNDNITRIKEIKVEDGGGGRVFQCTLCMKNYEELTSVLAHTVETHVPEEGPFFCVVCEKDCSSHTELSAHVNSHTGKYPYTCFVCGKAYSMKRYLKRHMSCHRELPRHRCPKCGERFAVKQELEAHLSTHVYTGPPFACSQCPRLFNHKGNYKRHLISHLDPHGSYLPKYPCDICGKRFLNNRTLQTHIRVHTGEKPYKCEVCERRFSQRGNLLNHERIHSNPRSYTCEVCGKRFNQRATLKDHSLLHTGEKPYVCNVCGQAFTFSAALRRHMWSHASDKPFGCDICDARFLGKYDLKRHLKIHTGPRPAKKSPRYAKDEPPNLSLLDEPSENHSSSLVDNRTNILIDEVLLVDQPIEHRRDHARKNVDLLFNLIEYG